MTQDLAHLGRVGDQGDDLHLRATAGAHQGVDLIDLCQQARPGRAAGGVWHSLRPAGDWG
jgi:hypothetical protein